MLSEVIIMKISKNIIKVKKKICHMLEKQFHKFILARNYFFLFFVVVGNVSSTNILSVNQQ